MSPEIKADEILIARVPDETGWHQTLAGNPLHVNVDGINADNNTQTIILNAEEIGGERTIYLRCDGTGVSSNQQREEGKPPQIEVVLLDRPIRISYTRTTETGRLGNNWGGIPARPQRVRYKETHKNPRWTRGHGQR